MIEGSDYAPIIDGSLIHELMRIICYNRTIYDDMSLEVDEYLGLSLGVRDSPLTTILTNVQTMMDQAAILILDNDCAFKVAHLILLVRHTLTFCTRG